MNRFVCLLLPALAGCAGAPSLPAPAPPDPPAAPIETPAAPPAAPVAPYYSVQLSSNRDEAVARIALAQVGDLPYARLEQRGAYFALRVGAFGTHDAAGAALKHAHARGYQDAAIRRISNPAVWISSTGAPSATVPPSPGPAGRPLPEGEVKVLAPAPLTEIPPADYDFPAAARALEAQVKRLLANEALARRDGYIYALDGASLLLYAAQRSDRAFYDALLERLRPLILNTNNDPFTRGFVLWRYKKGEKPEVSGAAEALLLARGLWAGAQAFGRPADRALALSVLEGYQRHVYELGGDWLVRKYYSFGNKTFANLSVITAYHPDFLAQVEAARPRETGPSLSERSYAVLERAATDRGLLYPLMQPEVNQTYPGLDLEVYAPNNVVIASDSCEAAEGAMAGRPRIAESVLEFARDEDRHDRNNLLYNYYDAESGKPIGRQVVSAPTYACLARLAVALNERAALKWLKPLLQLEMQSLAAVPQIQEAPLFGAGPLLLAAAAMGAFGN